MKIVDDMLVAGRLEELLRLAEAGPSSIRREVVAIVASTIGTADGPLPGTTSEELLRLLVERPESNLWPEIRRRIVEQARFEY